MTLPFPKSGAHTSHLSACFQPAVCPEPKFPQNSHVSHIWHHLGIFREGCVWLEAFLARVRHVNSLSHYVSTLAITRDSFFLSFRTTSQYMWSQFWPLMFRVAYGVYYWPIERTKRHWPRSSHAGQGVEANVWYCLLLPHLCVSLITTDICSNISWRSQYYWQSELRPHMFLVSLFE